MNRDDSDDGAIDLNRRAILESAVTLGLASAVSPSSQLSAASAPTIPAHHKPTVGIQIDVNTLSKPNLSPLLDDLQTRAGVNALFPFIYTYSGTWAGLPKSGFRGGNFAIPHMQYYKGVPLSYQEMRATELGDLDVLEHTITAAKPRGIKTFAWIIETMLASSTWQSMCEVDLHGRRHEFFPCNNSPGYRAYLLGLVEDYTRSYDIDGVMWASERPGSLLYLVRQTANRYNPPDGARCFCEYCVKKGAAQGINVERAKAGFREFEKFLRAGADGRPRDGYFATFFRLLLNYPELLAWENLWITSRGELMAAMFKRIKSINPNLKVGWHVYSHVSLSPFEVAEIDNAAMAQYSDFIKPVVYANIAGERIHEVANFMSKTALGDFSNGAVLELLYKTLGYEGPPYESVTQRGLSSDYVRRETRRTYEGAGPAVQIWPGIDIGVPTAEAGASKTTAENVKNDIVAAFEGGASGVILSRCYYEMDSNVLAGAGVALKELGYS